MATLPDKLYFRIGEVSRITGLEPHILRYWETEFEEIRPQRSNKQRLYRKGDVELILHIKDLLYTEKFTICGARKRIRDERSGSRGKKPSPGLLETLEEIRQELVEIKKLLDSGKRRG